MLDWGKLLGTSAGPPVSDIEVSELTQWLSPRLVSWIKPEALDRAEIPAPKPIRLNAGEFGILLHLPAGTHMQPGAVLPCRWVESSSSASGAPRSLVECAVRARETLLSSPLGEHLEEEARDRANGLSLALGEGCPDLTDFQCGTLDSAQAILTATLHLAAKGYPIVADTTVSASLDPVHGLGQVDHLDEKLVAAECAGIKTVIVAAAQPQAGGASRSAACKCVPVDGQSAANQFGGLLLRLGAPPVGGSLEDKADWYDRNRWFKGTGSRCMPAQLFYADHIAKPFGQQLRESTRGASAPRELLIFLATGAFETSCLLASLFTPSRILMVTFDGHSKEFAHQACALLHDNRDPKKLPVEIMALHELLQHSKETWKNSGIGIPWRPVQWVADMTGGPTLGKFQFEAWARRHRIPRYLVSPLPEDQRQAGFPRSLHFELRDSTAWESSG